MSTDRLPCHIPHPTYNIRCALAARHIGPHCTPDSEQPTDSWPQSPAGPQTDVDWAAHDASMARLREALRPITRT